MLNLVDTSSPTWQIADLTDQIRLVFARRETVSVCSVSQEPTEPCSLSPRNLFKFFTLRSLPTTIALSRDFLVLPPCRTHISILLHESATPRPHDPTYLYFLTVLHAYLPPEKRMIRGIVCTVTLFVKHLY